MGDERDTMLYRVLALLLITGLLASAPLAGIAQDKKDKDEVKKADDVKKDDVKKDDVKKDDEPKKVDEPPKKEEKVVATPAPATHIVTVPSDANRAAERVSEILPIVTLVLIVVLFVLLLGVRSEIKNLEQKLHSDGKV